MTAQQYAADRFAFFITRETRSFAISTFTSARGIFQSNRSDKYFIPVGIRTYKINNRLCQFDIYFQFLSGISTHFFPPYSLFCKSFYCREISIRLLSVAPYSQRCRFRQRGVLLFCRHCRFFTRQRFI